MNNAAVKWAASQQPPQAADKLALWALAHHAEVKTLRAWPSVAAICAFTGLKRKVVLASVSRLERAGLIEDTGDREGRTRQIRVFRLVMPVR